MRAEGGETDEDTFLMKDLLNLDDPLEALTPVLLNQRYLDQYGDVDYAAFRQRIVKSFETISEGMDAIMIEALHEPSLGCFIGLSVPRLAKALGSCVLLVSSTQKDYVVDEVIFEKERICAEGANCLGIVFNYIPKMHIERVRDLMAPILGKHGIPTWGIIPECTPITAPSVGMIAEVLNAEILSGQGKEDLLVENYLVGAMTQESAIRYFRTTPRKAIITGGDRPDICLAALETDTSALILTGNLHPDVLVIARADERGVPILLVPYDTFTTVRKLDDVTGKIRIGDSKRVALARDLVSDYVDWEGLVAQIRPVSNSSSADHPSS
jgi:hypothetical protein